MAKMAKGRFSHAAIEAWQQQIYKPCSEVREEEKQGVVFPGYNKVKADLKRQAAMVCENQTDCCLPCQIGTRMNPQTGWRRKGTGAPPLWWAPHWPGMPPAPPDDSERTQSSETEGVPPGYVYIHTPLPSAWFFNLDWYAKDCMRGKIFFQICSLMKIHTQVSTLSAVW